MAALRFALLALLQRLVFAADASVRLEPLVLPLQRQRAERPPIAGERALEEGTVAETELRRAHEMPYDMAVVAEVKVGTPPQTLKVLLDTGSGDFWLPSSRCGWQGNASKRSGSQHTHGFLDERASSTFQLFRRQPNGGLIERNIRYGYGHIQSVVVRDQVRFAGIEVQQQSFLLATSMDFPSDHLWDGIMGLGFPQPFPEFAGGGQPLLAELKGGGVAPVVTFVPGMGDRAQLRLGRGSYEKVVGHGMTWANSLSGEHWIIDAVVSFGQQHKSQRVIVDTGTSLILVPPADFLVAAKALCAGQGCLLDSSHTRVFAACSRVPLMPSVQITLNTTTFILGAEDLFERTGRPMVKGKQTGEQAEEEEACEFLLSVTPVNRQEWILGDVFLRKVVTVFDFEHARVGFAVPWNDPRAQLRKMRSGPNQACEVRWIPYRPSMRGASNNQSEEAVDDAVQAWKTPFHLGVVGAGSGQWLLLFGVGLALPMGAWRARTLLRRRRGEGVEQRCCRSDIGSTSGSAPCLE